MRARRGAATSALSPRGVSTRIGVDSERRRQRRQLSVGQPLSRCIVKYISGRGTATVRCYLPLLCGSFDEQQPGRRANAMHRGEHPLGRCAAARTEADGSGIRAPGGAMSTRRLSARRATPHSHLRQRRPYSLAHLGQRAVEVHRTASIDPDPSRIAERRRVQQTRVEIEELPTEADDETAPGRGACDNELTSGVHSWRPPESQSAGLSGLVRMRKRYSRALRCAIGFNIRALAGPDRD